MMPRVGLELIDAQGQRILSPLHLPISSHWHVDYTNFSAYRKMLNTADFESTA